ncbi:gliding motility-associated C-terminal domain-containing protein [Neolewinella agarilytica]|uniref:gliding motility-associated C-terminal domain-containing protein n=1 Tax=Neolewinella agarilytica TaxID=478744 RepID=UPI002354D1C1|nr:gliding motility-associated C-terminal domain-containing protein [Neolewinella agarilytica]
MRLNLYQILAGVCLLYFPLFLTAQGCTGNLGENIFTEGDFGSGAATILTDDPQIAPGFIYQRNPPPNDGFYTITNDMRSWAGTFPTWTAFADNSSDPNGYMMVVNAAFQPGKFYEQEVTGLCENTEYQFTADVRNILRRGTNGLTPNVSFSIDDVTQFTTGPVPENEIWNTYGFSFATAPGQTTVTLALSNNAPGGFGNDLAIDNISFRACGPEARIAGAENISICEDGAPTTLTASVNGDEYDSPAFQWQQSFDEGMTWENLPGENGMTYGLSSRASGFYYYRYLLANGSVNLANTKCRVVSNVKVVYVVPKRYGIVDTLCAGLSFSVGPNVYDRTGVFVDTLLSSLGCDSIVTLRLEVVPDPGLLANFRIQPPSCSDRSDGEAELLGVANGAGPFTLTFLDTLQPASRLFSGLPEADYAYRVVDRFGCADEGSISLVSPFPFTVDLGEDQTVELGEPAEILVMSQDTVASYQYLPDLSFDCNPNCGDFSFIPENTFTLRLEAVSVNGCEASDSIRIRVIKERKVYLPTAFSPDGDGVNDQFTIFGAVPNVSAVLRLEIFDRWGGSVFLQENQLPNDPAGGWDGTINGEDAPAGAYYFTAELLFVDGESLPYQGTFVLVR